MEKGGGRLCKKGRRGEKKMSFGGCVKEGVVDLGKKRAWPEHAGGVQIARFGGGNNCVQGGGQGCGREKRETSGFE